MSGRSNLAELTSKRTECQHPSGPEVAPRSVLAIRRLGKGRAAQAVLVEADMPDGSRRLCVEKVFAAGWLTRTIYRLSFQSPFAYQSNRDAILACFYRRRVAAAVLDASDTEVKIAPPIYVRFDRENQSWVLAAEWIDGRGIKPAPADSRRMRRSLLQTKSAQEATSERPEIDSLVESMGRLETLFATCGLVGSGWQVAPRAMVSTANLLREPGHYTIIDLESGIPAVLVPKYLLRGACRGELPPFDDLDAERLRHWLATNHQRLRAQLGSDRLAQLDQDAEKLIEHTASWKASELAVLRRPWRLLRRNALAPYQRQCVGRWLQEETVDAATAVNITEQRWKARLIWYTGLLPGLAGRTLSRLIGNRDFRQRIRRCIEDAEFRKTQWNLRLRRTEADWIESGRIGPATRLNPLTLVLHQGLAAVTPASIHRFLADRRYRSDRCRKICRLLLCSRYQAWFGRAWIKSSIESWRQSGRITDPEALLLRSELSGREVQVYVRGMGAHAALKMLAPFLSPVKYGGFATFVASGNAWFLLPLLLMPAARTLVTLASWWSSRGTRIPHAEALLAGLLPTVGSIAFPLQMFTTRGKLSTFLIRDAASKLGRRIPIYGGPNSRTEIAMIRSTDFLIEAFETISILSNNLRGAARPALPLSVASTAKYSRQARWIRSIRGVASRRIPKYEQGHLEECADPSEPVQGGRFVA